MRAEHTRAGGRHMLDERGGYDGRSRAPDASLEADHELEIGWVRPASTAPLIESLSGECLVRMAKLQMHLPRLSEAA